MPALAPVTSKVFLLTDPFGCLPQNARDHFSRIAAEPFCRKNPPEFGFDQPLSVAVIPAPRLKGAAHPRGGLGVQRIQFD